MRWQSTVRAVALITVLVACGSDSSDDVAALEEQVAELEAQLTTTAPPTTVVPTTTTTSTTTSTTTTVPPPTTTSTTAAALSEDAQRRALEAVFQGDYKQTVTEFLLSSFNLDSVDVIRYSPEAFALQISATSGYSSEDFQREQAWDISRELAEAMWVPTGVLGGGDERFTIETTYILDLSGLIYLCSHETMLAVVDFDMSRREWEAACA